MDDRIKCNNCNIEYPPRAKSVPYDTGVTLPELDYSCPICGSRKLSEGPDSNKKMLLDQKYAK